MTLRWALGYINNANAYSVRYRKYPWPAVQQSTAVQCNFTAGSE